MSGAAAKEFLWIGNSACLDFINTQMVREGLPVDLLGGFEDLVTWLAEAQVLDGPSVNKILEAWDGSREAERVAARAKDFRAVLRRTMERIVEDKSVPQAAMTQINELLRHQAGHSEMKRARGGFEKRFRADFKEPIQLLWPVAESACDLLCYADLSLVRKCENEACVLFFYDTTKNHSRRWCSMGACGNRAKVAAYYRRLRGAARS